MPRLRVALAQTNPVVGDFRGNLAGIVQFAEAAAAAGADLVGFGEMALSGYPIEDLATRPEFLEASRRHVIELAGRLDDAGLGDLPVVVGYPDGPFEPRAGSEANAPTAIAQNCAAVLYRGEMIARYAKHHLPNYSVFDEYRNFIAGDGLLVLRLGDVDVAILICEDIWRDSGPVSRVLEADAGVLLVLNGSPFQRGKDAARLPLVTRRAIETDTVVAYVNLVGGQDDLVFDGDSVVVNQAGDIQGRAPQFTEHLLVVDTEPEAATDRPEDPRITRVVLPERRDREARPIPADVAVPAGELEQIWGALTLGLADYVNKNDFSSVLLGLSGGIDSAVSATIACDALGADRVYGVSMPSRYSSDHSRSDADDLAERLGLHYRVEAIENLVAPFEDQFGFSGLAAENLQARVRAVLLMGLANAGGHLLLTTGNKTEISVGYSTIYGDSAGGFAPIKDVPKTLVWELARWRNERAATEGATPPIPENSITKPPSAELRPDQTDQDSLPEYPRLDAMLAAYVEDRTSRSEIIAAGFDAEEVDGMIRLLDRAEWKRRQGAIGPKISPMAFGRDRRLPITYRPTDGQPGHP